MQQIHTAKALWCKCKKVGKVQGATSPYVLLVYMQCGFGFSLVALCFSATFEFGKDNCHMRFIGYLLIWRVGGMRVG